ncbi:hypothetical protein [Acaryochloris sp. IP29b_bin.148]|uniref:hypothetical protein n=1 Tax=Acaryochloris sp. IP29b_bin.148 TaxID=2969218 RepID=UPI002631C707|nr:hypothetical protein [Acaryochloris sp. IP29b_bin.148]
MTKLQLPKRVGLAVGTITVSSILQVTCFSSLALADIENKDIDISLSESKVSLCQDSLHKGSGEIFDYSQTFSVPNSQPVTLATSQSTGVFTGFQAATYAEQLEPKAAGGFVWCVPCPYNNRPGCWAFVGDCH